MIFIKSFDLIHGNQKIRKPKNRQVNFTSDIWKEVIYIYNNDEWWKMDLFRKSLYHLTRHTQSPWSTTKRNRFASFLVGSGLCRILRSVKIWRNSNNVCYNKWSTWTTDWSKSVQNTFTDMISQTCQRSKKHLEILSLVLSKPDSIRLLPLHID